MIPETMQALVLHGPNDFSIEEVSVPQPGPMELLCQVHGVFICGTDPHIIAGEYPGFWPKEFPLIPGHEWAGTVVALGEGAEKFGWQAGDRVAGTSHCGCGYCRMCRSGRYNMCENYGREDLGHRQYGHYSSGAYANYVVHSVKSVVKVPTELSLDEAAAIDPTSIALHTAKRGNITPGDTIVVIGSGSMGLFAQQCAHILGAGRVIVIGSGQRLELARSLGAETIDYRKEDSVAAIRELTGGRGAPVVIECAGTTTSVRQSVEMVQKGGTISIIGIPIEPTVINVKKLVLDEIDLHGVRANRGTVEEVVPLLVSERIKVRPLMTHTFPLKEFKQALEIFTRRQDGAIKILMKP